MYLYEKLSFYSNLLIVFNVLFAWCLLNMYSEKCSTVMVGTITQYIKSKFMLSK